MDQATFASEHRRFLQENRPDVLAQFESDGDLSQYLSSIGQQAEDRMATLLVQMNNRPEIQDLPYQKKVATLQSHQHSAAEIVRDEIVFQPRED